MSGSIRVRKNGPCEIGEGEDAWVDSPDVIHGRKRRLFAGAGGRAAAVAYTGMAKLNMVKLRSQCGREQSSSGSGQFPQPVWSLDERSISDFGSLNDHRRMLDCKFASRRLLTLD